MVLQQKRFPWIRGRLELTDTALLVATSQPFRGSRSEIPLGDLKPIPSYFRQFALSSLMFAISLTLFAAAILGGVFDVALAPERVGLLALFVPVGFFAVCFWLRFYSRNVDCVIFHDRRTGRPLVYIHRLLPSTRHVEEFVEILREKIEHATPN